MMMGEYEARITRNEQGVLFVEGRVVDLKLDAARNVYWKRREENRKNFHLIDKKFPVGLTRDEKASSLLRLHRLFEAALTEQPDADDDEDGERRDGVVVEIDEEED